jgi:hypothetical protein
MATMSRFVLILGVVLFGGLTIAFAPSDLGPPIDRAATFAVFKLIMGACWGFGMWFVFRWLKKRRNPS